MACPFCLSLPPSLHSGGYLPELCCVQHFDISVNTGCCSLWKLPFVVPKGQPSTTSIDSSVPDSITGKAGRYCTARSCFWTLVFWLINCLCLICSPYADWSQSLLVELQLQCQHWRLWLQIELLQVSNASGNCSAGLRQCKVAGCLTSGWGTENGAKWMNFDMVFMKI